jgi:hypothetical protein
MRLPEPCSAEPLMSMMEYCALAHRLVAPRFLKVVEHAIITWIIDDEFLPSGATIVFAFENLPCASLILRLLVDTYCQYYDEDIHNEDKKEGAPLFPYEFLVRCMLRHCNTRDYPLDHLSTCDYHGHGSDAERKGCSN